MKTKKLIINYGKYADIKLDFIAQNVINCLTDNPNFPTTLPPLPGFITIKENYTECLSKAANGGKNEIALKNQARAILVAAMRQLATDIEAQANGDNAKLVSSGFEPASSGEHVLPIGIPTDFVISDGLNPGEIKLSVRRVTNAVTYVHEYTIGEVTENSVWIQSIGTSREHVFTGIKSGVKVSARVKVIGRKGQEVCSVILTRVVQ
jgi:hypothetical protein